MKTPESEKSWRGIPLPSEDEATTGLHESHTDALARRQPHDSIEARGTPPSAAEKKEDHALFRDPNMTPSVDFGNEDGFHQVAKKKKGKAGQAQKSSWDGDNEEKKGEGEEEGEKENEGDKGGDPPADAGDGDKKDEGDGNGDGAGDEDPWSAFAPAKKKKGKKGKVEEVTEPTPAAKDEKEEKFDAFHEIKLDDTTPMLDLNFGTDTKSSSGFGSWGSSWATGTT